MATDMLVYRSDYEEPNRSRRVALKDVMDEIKVIRRQGHLMPQSLH
jgi:hypothetical protein